MSALMGRILTICRVKPDITRTLEEMKHASGPWDYWSTAITCERFSLTSGNLGSQEVILFCFNKYLTDIQINDRLARRGYERVTELPVILAFLEANRGLRQRVPIVSGATWVNSSRSRDNTYTVVARNDVLELERPIQGWTPLHQFLVRRHNGSLWSCHSFCLTSLARMSDIL